ncbi:MAG: tRNA (adenosine(37)-N6)-dimethylallyltransferase MiaA, partial [Proteobacteria bacterium]|nr:tRNA (adenosine(37)-N6)-dimethylallyltransferase MiaA [Pseudomonadota bacterium]
YLQGECSLEETIDSLKRDTRKYAKRQLTWFRAEPDVLWVDPDNINMVLNRISLFLAKGT